MARTRRNGDSAPEGRFTALRLQNVRCFEEVAIQLDPQMTVMIGENGTGKTTVAEALASLSYGETEGLSHFPLRRDTRHGEIALFDAAHTDSVAIWRHDEASATHQRLPLTRYLFAYGRYRRIHDPGTWEDPESLVNVSSLLDELANAVTERRTTTLNHPDGRLLRDLSRYLVAIHEARSFDPRMDTIWDRLQQSLRELRQGLERIEMVEGEMAYIPMVVRRGVRLGLNELSDGYQAVLVIVFDLILRYTFLFSTLSDPLAGTATVMIDEVDLHLHVRWQRLVLRQLTTLFPGTQFVVTTHSPAVVQAAIDDGHHIITLREKKGTVEATPLSARKRKQLQGAGIDSLFIEKLLFGADSRYSAQVQTDEDEVRRLRRKVESDRATDTDRERLFVLLNRLEGLVASEAERHESGPLISEMTKLQLAFLKELAMELDEK
ncbi:MAG: hypothetical protein ETSY1_03445 [Candidatus Entotheonella factor]|uniref:AAA+ ATPase domain-containing protein n=1 Tax=Entotheonella factor TaxID=1429438 RepID=W4LYL2_ENTF1|nr:AAA family ATPase [Candidatus Entotheonella palauensis]ETX02462.1 MAG: hypothetical protein ETSY1_03445 [Candidatus Entotheonella factor]